MSTHIPCEHCEDGVLWVSRCGGLDPDVRPYECDACNGSGATSCVETGCTEHATHLRHEGQHSYPLCAAHHSRWEEAFNA
jgi:hypothetical protein